jgi:hypothetical protein
MPANTVKRYIATSIPILLSAFIFVSPWEVELKLSRLACIGFCTHKRKVAANPVMASKKKYCSMAFLSDEGRFASGWLRVRGIHPLPE